MAFGRGSIRRFLVTGCAGFIGSRLSEALLADGCEVLGVDALTDFYSPSHKKRALNRALGHSNFAFHELDLTNAPLIELASGVGGIFHLGAQPGVRVSWGPSFDAYAINNLVASQRVLDCASQLGIRVVLASSSSIYGDAETYPTSENVEPRPISPYGVTKLACEHLARAYAASEGGEVITLRYFTVYGPRQRPDMAFARVIDALSEGRSFQVFGDGRQSRDFTFIDDAVAATIAAMEDAPPGAVYNVGGGSEATLRDVITIIEKLSDLALDVEFRDHAVGDVRRTLADTTRIRSDLGWTPRTGLREGLRAQLGAHGVPLLEPSSEIPA